MNNLSLQILIVDDEIAARKKVRRFLTTLGAYQQIWEAINVPEARKIIQQEAIDLVFLDIQMPGENGFELIRSIGYHQMPPVIFITAFDQYALRAFEVQAIDYLLKPFDEERFQKAYNKALGQLQSGENWPELFQQLISNMQQQTEFLERIMVSVGSKVLLLPVTEIEVFSADDKYVGLHTASRHYLLRESISKLAEQLNPAHFARIHRSYLINLDAVQEMTHRSHGDYLVRMKSGMEVIMSRRYRENVFGSRK